MKRIGFVLLIFLTVIVLYASQEKPFREEDMLIANMEDPIGDIQPNGASDSLNVRGIGIIPYDVTTNVFVIDTFSYVCKGYYLVILSIGNKSLPKVLGVYSLPSSSSDIYVSGNYAYVADGPSGLRIINISDPSSPTEVGYYDTPGYAYGVYVSGSYAYVADGGSGLRIINISDPSSPTSVGYYDTPGGAMGVYISGSYAYVADGGSGLRIINISDPSSPTSVGYYDTPGSAYGVYVSGSYAYVADYTSGLRIINISSPASPTEVGYYDTPGNAYDVYVSGSYAFVADYNSGLQIINVSNPSSPTLAGNESSPKSRALFVSGNYVYVACWDYGLYIIDVSNPSSPTYTSRYNTMVATENVYVSDNYAYSASSDYGLRILNVLNPSSPTFVGRYDTPGYAFDVYVSGNYAYVADYDSGVQIIDVSNPSSPTLAGTYHGDRADRIYILGNYAYFINSGRLVILDISNPSNPTYVSEYSNPTPLSYLRDIYVSGNYAYISYQNGLRIINVSNPSSPTLAGTISGYSSAGVYVSGNYAYLASNNAGLKIIDVSNPSSPTLAGTYDTPGYARDVYVSGNYAYVAEDSSLQVIDISNPTNPTIGGYYSVYKKDEVFSFCYVSEYIIYTGYYSFFLLSSTAPNIVDLVSPADNSYTTSNLLVWHKSPDNLNGIKYYELWYDEDSLFGSAEAETLTDTTFTPTLLEQKYYWKVRAIDHDYNVGVWSTKWNFEYDGSAPATPILVYPTNNEEVEDSFVMFDWDGVTKTVKVGIGLNATAVSYTIQIDTLTSFAVPVYWDTTTLDSILIKITKDKKYYWRIKAYDEAGNQGDWTNIDSFFIDIKIPVVALNVSSHNYYDLDTNKTYLWNGLFIKNIGDGILEVDSMSVLNTAFTLDTTYSYPISINPLDSFIVPINAQFSDTGMVNSFIRVHHSIYSDKYDSVNLVAYFGMPTLIDSARAYDGTNIVNGIDADDYIVLFFNQATNGATIDATNIDNVLTLNNSHSWLDGFGALGTTTWNPAKSTLMINLTTSLTVPTIAVGDTLFPDSSTIIGTLNSFKCHYPVQLRGGFGGETDTTKPISFNLIQPSGKITDNTPTYIWHKSGDLYFKNYELYVDGGLKTTLNDTLYTESTPIVDGLYSWYVVAVDSTGNRRNSNQTDTFEIDLTPPSSISLVSPTNNSSVASISLVWHTGTDNYSGIKRYNLLYDDDSLFGSSDSFEVTDTTYTASLTEGTYYWKVRAIDNFDNIGDWSSVWSFTYALTGITDKFTLETKEKHNTELTVTMNQVSYTSLANENEFRIYDIAGKVVHSELNNRTGKHIYNTEHLSSGIYFIRFNDGEKKINKKMVIIK